MGRLTCVVDTIQRPTKGEPNLFKSEATRCSRDCAHVEEEYFALSLQLVSCHHGAARSFLGADEHHVTVSAIPADMKSAEVRTATERTREEAEARRDYLLMSLATELRARGHEVVEAIE